MWQQLMKRNVVRIAALYLAASWLVLQVADLVVDAYGLPRTLMQLLIAVLAIGLPAAIALAWIYRWTPDGLRKESESEPYRGGRTITLTILVVLGLALGVLMLGRSFGPGESAPAHSPPRGSIAVIPFANNSESSDSDYFADGLSVELLNLLADVPELQVIGRTSAFRYKDSGLDPKTIGTELNVAHIIEGEVRKAGDQLRISVQLIDTQSGYQIWRDTYDAMLADIFELQNEIAARDSCRTAPVDIGRYPTGARYAPGSVHRIS